MSRSYRDKDAVVEFTTNEITAICPVTGQPEFYDLNLTYLEDLVAACEPVEMTVDLMQRVRGGLKIRTVVRHAL